MEKSLTANPSAKIVLDSVSPAGHRVTTMEVTLHRFVLSELNTHRVFSRNSASSRAIPVEKQLKAFKNDPWFPIEWSAEQRGMQGGSELEGDDLFDAQTLFFDIHKYTASRVEEYLADHPDKSTRLHKSLINRLYEWGQMHKVIITSTEWDGFWSQRCSELAQPEIKVAAEMMREAYEASEPNKVGFGEWHTPYIEDEDWGAVWRLLNRNAIESGNIHGQSNIPSNSPAAIELINQVSVARSARVSYLNHDGTRDIEKDIDLYNRLVSADPLHASPMEHVCTPAHPGEIMAGDVLGNLTGWHQLRHEVEKQC